MKHLLSLLSFIVIFSIHTKGQSTIDSLENELKKDLPDSIRLKVLINLTSPYFDINTDKNIELANEAILLIPSSKNQKDIGRAYLNAGLAQESVGKYQEGLLHNLRALSIYQNIKDSLGLSSAYNNIGIVYNHIGDYGLAVYHLIKAIQIDEHLKDTLALGIDYINLAEAYYFSKNYTTAIFWSRRSYENFSKPAFEAELPYAIETMVTILLAQNKIDSAHLLTTKVKTLAAKFKNEFLASKAQLHYGKILLYRNQIDSAIIILNACVKQNTGKHLSDILLPANLALGKGYLQSNKLNKATEIGQFTYRESRKIKNKLLAMECAEFLSAVYLKLNNAKLGIDFLQTASLYKDSILEQSLQSSIEAKMFDLDLDKAKREKQQAILFLGEKELTVTRQQYILISAGVALLSLLIITLLIRKSSVERQRINKLLTSNNLQLNKLNQEVNGLINTIVHDLKSPLNSMQGLLYLLEAEMKESEKAKLYISQGNKVLAGGHEIIQQLLELRELEEKPAALFIESIKLKEFVELLQMENGAYAQQKNIEIIAETDETNIEIDKTFTKRLLNNLISNAIKFSHSGKQVRISAKVNSSHITFEITDQGQGFTIGDKSKLFQKFQKLSARPTGGESSNGLGLAIVQLLANRLRATVELKSEWGKGATFIVSIPLA